MFGVIDYIVEIKLFMSHLSIQFLETVSQFLALHRPFEGSLRYIGDFSNNERDRFRVVLYLRKFQHTFAMVGGALNPSNSRNKARDILGIQ